MAKRLGFGAGARSALWSGEGRLFRLEVGGRRALRLRGGKWRIEGGRKERTRLREARIVRRRAVSVERTRKAISRAPFFDSRGSESSVGGVSRLIRTMGVSARSINDGFNGKEREFLTSNVVNLNSLDHAVLDLEQELNDIVATFFNSLGRDGRECRAVERDVDSVRDAFSLLTILVFEEFSSRRERKSEDGLEAAW